MKFLWYWLCLLLLLTKVSMSIGQDKIIDNEPISTDAVTEADAGDDETQRDAGVLDDSEQATEVEPAPAVETLAVSSSIAPSASPSRAPLHLAVFVNPMAAFMWGATAGVEFGRKSAVAARLRIPNAGWFPYMLEGSDSEFQWGLGATLGVRRYFFQKISRPEGFYVGLIFGYYQVNGRRPTYDWYLGYLEALFDVGYRRTLGGLLVSIGGALGAFINIRRKLDYDFGWEVADSALAPLPVAEITLELGWIGELR